MKTLRMRNGNLHKKKTFSCAGCLIALMGELID
jgi:hypothetical protein